ncbi:MAG TPA: DUF4440 domain-containing protein [bacterium]|nr:DUF4440 domain-containing protein [bacterium]
MDFNHERTAIAQWFRRLERAIVEDDLFSLRDTIHPEFSAILPPDEVAVGFNGLFNYYRALISESDYGPASVSLDIDRTQFLWEGVALVTGTAHEKRLRGGDAMYLDSRFTAVLVQEEGDWKLVRLHCSLDPLNNPYTGARAQGVGIAAGAVGALLGAGTALLVGSRRR